MRTSGILMPVFSLPSKYGIGSLGKEAYRFIDFLYNAGQSRWQILPLNPTNYGDSPYQSFSSFAGNPYFIDIETLIDEGLLEKNEADSFDFGDDATTIDYGKLYINRPKLLRLAFNRFIPDSDYKSFTEQNSDWLFEYALFMALKNANNDVSWTEWEKPLYMREPEALEKARTKHRKDIEFYCFLQYKFFTQWLKLKDYANQKGIKIIGDIPIYVAYDSAEVWSAPEMFMLDSKKKPKSVAGCPPDAFSADGQLWGNPLYNWKYMKETDYKWWKARIANALSLYDIVRIDHFRGFESFYAIPYGAETAKDGKWLKGPGSRFFDALKEEFGKDIPIIAEDLGFLTPAVNRMLKNTGFPGMKVLQFAFDSDSDNEYLPHNHKKNSVIYTGTHDNNTIMGWVKESPDKTVKTARRYMHVDDNEGFNWAMMRTALMSVADTAILMLPDFMGLDETARINEPSTIGGNWCWRISDGCLNDWLAGIIRENTALYGRLPQEAESTDETAETNQCVLQPHPTDATI